MTNRKTIGAAAVLALAGGCLIGGASAGAFEAGHNPDTLAGVTIGAAPGAAPPPGFYFANNLSYQAQSLYDDNGHKLPINAAAWIELPILLWVPNFHLLGAQYSASLVQPIVQATPTAFGVTHTQTGIFNTAINPITLSWQLPEHLYVSSGLTVYPPDGTDNKRAAVNIGNNWWTLSPDVAITYLNQGWNLSLKTTLDINSLSKSGDSGVTSGDVLIADYTVARSFGKWKLGAGGFFVQQVSNDSPSGAATAGKKLQRFALGPTVGYDFGPVDLTAYYTRDVVTRNTGGGDQFWFQLSLPLQ